MNAFASIHPNSKISSRPRLDDQTSLRILLNTNNFSTLSSSRSAALACRRIQQQRHCLCCSHPAISAHVAAKTLPHFLSHEHFAFLFCPRQRLLSLSLSFSPIMHFSVFMFADTLLRCTYKFSCAATVGLLPQQKYSIKCESERKVE